MAGTSRALLAGRLKELRGRRGYTQQAVAEKSRLDYKYYQRIEGKRPPNLTVDSLERLARVFGVGLAELLQRPLPSLAGYVRDAGDAPRIQYRLARRLRRLRQRAGWTREETAARAGLTPSALERLEDSKNPASARVDTLERLAKAFSLSPAQLLDFSS